MSFDRTRIERLWHQNKASFGFQGRQFASRGILEFESVQKASQRKENLNPC